MTKRILLPIDLNQRSSWEQTIPIATQMAAATGASLDVLTVIPDFGMSVVGSFFPPEFESNAIAEAKKALDGFVSEHFTDAGSVTAHVQHGSVYKEIIAVADQLGCDLIIMGSHRPETKDYLLGPNAARVVRHAKQSVYVVRETS